MLTRHTVLILIAALFSISSCADESPSKDLCKKLVIEVESNPDALLRLSEQLITLFENPDDYAIYEIENQIYISTSGVSGNKPIYIGWKSFENSLISISPKKHVDELHLGTSLDIKAVRIIQITSESIKLSLNPRVSNGEVKLFQDWNVRVHCYDRVRDKWISMEVSQ